MISGKTALITGSTSGIGKAIATRFARDGCNVILNGFGDAAEIEAFRKDLAGDAGVLVGYSDADLTQSEAICGMMDYAQRDFGGADILVNNAGTQFVAPLEDFPVEKWDLIIALNMTAAFHTTRLALPGMKAKGWGRILNIGSAHSKVASPFKSAYVTAKHGLDGLTKVTALEGAEHGVRSNLICPGYVHTPLVDGQIQDTAKARGMTPEDVKNQVILNAQPTKQFVTVEQIAGFARFLCSADADQINGAALSVDGGWVAH